MIRVEVSPDDGLSATAFICGTALLLGGIYGLGVVAIGLSVLFWAY